MAEVTVTDPTTGRDGDEPVAVVGMACRLPGAPDPSAFWQLLREGRDAIGAPPADRHPAPHDMERPGGYLDRVDGFDAAFFGVSPARHWPWTPAATRPRTGLGSAGGRRYRPRLGRRHPRRRLRRCDLRRLRDPAAPERPTRHHPAHVHRHPARRHRQPALVLAGAAGAEHDGGLRPVLFPGRSPSGRRQPAQGRVEPRPRGRRPPQPRPREHPRRRALRRPLPDARCFTFDARANGFVRGEGGALVVLKPLSRALADGDRVYCVIHGSAVNHDGAGEALAVPNADAQREVIDAALGTAGVHPDEVQYVELHGTGTPVGDPVEAQALGAAFGTGTERSAPLAVGSAKTNVGHLEGAAGVVGLIKAALSSTTANSPPASTSRPPPRHPPRPPEPAGPDRDRPMAPARPPVAGGRLLVRSGRNQRPPRPGRGPANDGPRHDGAAQRSGPVDGVGGQRGSTLRLRHSSRRPHGSRPGPPTRRCGPHVGHHPCGTAVPGGGRRRGPGQRAERTALTGRRAPRASRRHERRTGHTGAQGPGIRVPGAGLAVGAHGPRPVRGQSSLP